MRVAVCIITCRRPQGLARLLEGLARLTFVGPPPQMQIIVVDNDTQESGCRVCERRAASYPWPLSWSCEPRRGIPFARNTAFRLAGDVDFVVYIDDDEVPAPGWLDELLRVQALYDADVVAGPVLSDLGAQPPAWAVRGGFFARPRRPTGTRIEHAFTGNVLFRRQTLAAMEVPFDEDMALMGGSDAYLSRQLAMSSARMVWADEALVTESVPASRLSAIWVWRRAFRAGVSRAFTEQRLARSVVDRVRTVTSGALHIGRGAARLPVALVGGRHLGIAAARDASYGIGLLAGTVGFRYDEYKTVHGR